MTANKGRFLRLAQLTLRLLLGGLLLVGGYSKIAAFDWWRDLVYRMDIFPHAISGPLSAILPGIEIVAGMALCVGFLSRPAALLCIFLQVIFTAVMTTLVLKNAPQSCGCFGPGSEYPVDALHLMSNVLQLAFAFLLYRLPVHVWSLDRFRRQFQN